VARRLEAEAFELSAAFSNADSRASSDFTDRTKAVCDGAAVGGGAGRFPAGLTFISSSSSGQTRCRAWPISQIASRTRRAAWWFVCRRLCNGAPENQREEDPVAEEAAENLTIIVESRRVKRAPAGHRALLQDGSGRKSSRRSAVGQAAQ
jgi:hypothetical protein